MKLIKAVKRRVREYCMMAFCLGIYQDLADRRFREKNECRYCDTTMQWKR